jgi:hypothetical protein
VLQYALRAAIRCQSFPARRVAQILSLRHLYLPVLVDSLSPVQFNATKKEQERLCSHYLYAFSSQQESLACLRFWEASIDSPFFCRS